MTNQGTGRAAGVDAPDDGATVTLRQVMAAVRAASNETMEERRAARDALIRQALAAGLMSQAEMHRRTGLSEQHIGRIAKGSRPDRPTRTTE